MTMDRLIAEIAANQPNVRDGGGLENTVDLIREYDAKNPNSSIILLLGAGDIDGLRSQIMDQIK